MGRPDTARLVADIGSTFTKARLFGPDGGIEWSGQAPTRPGELRQTERMLRAAAAADGVTLPAGRIAACSSAAGGLRLAVLGLTRTFTFEAALHAALGAGARIVGRFAGSLADADLADLRAAAPDVVLLTGGSDDGDRTAAVEFARRLAGLDRRLAVVVACNRAAAPECRAVLERAGHTTVVVGNVLPELDRVDFEPARAAIRELFLGAVIGRLDDQRPHGFDVLMPTPAAVLGVTELLADVGSASLLVVDVGGATTDVHSAFATAPPAHRGLSVAATQRSLRTVEADLGLRESAPSLLAAAGDRGPDRPCPPAELAARVASLSAAVHTVAAPGDRLDGWLARLAATVGIERHVGEWVAQMSPDGVTMTPLGRDLRRVELVVGTGGALSRDSAGALAGAVAGTDRRRLVPAAPTIRTDREYALPCLGVLAHVDPALGRTAAERLLPAMPSIPAKPANDDRTAPAAVMDRKGSRS